MINFATLAGHPFWQFRKWLKSKLARYLTVIEFCHDCGREQPVIWWCESNELWAEVAGQDYVEKPYYAGGILCPKCFERRARKKGILIRWIAAEDRNEN